MFPAKCLLTYKALVAHLLWLISALIASKMFRVEAKQKASYIAPTHLYFQPKEEAHQFVVKIVFHTLPVHTA